MEFSLFLDATRATADSLFFPLNFSIFSQPGTHSSAKSSAVLDAEIVVPSVIGESSQVISVFCFFSARITSELARCYENFTPHDEWTHFICEKYSLAKTFHLRVRNDEMMFGPILGHKITRWKYTIREDKGKNREAKDTADRTLETISSGLERDALSNGKSTFKEKRRERERVESPFRKTRLVSTEARPRSTKSYFLDNSRKSL